MRTNIPAGADPRILPAAESRSATPARAARLVLCGLAVASVLGSAPLRRWTESLPDSDATVIVQDAAARWDAAMGHLGAHALHDRVRGAVRALEALRF